jgi:hypothetical protein
MMEVGFLASPLVVAVLCWAGGFSAGESALVMRAKTSSQCGNMRWTLIFFFEPIFGVRHVWVVRCGAHTEAGCRAVWGSLSQPPTISTPSGFAESHPERLIERKRER